MADVGGMLASAVLKVVTQQIGSAIGGQIKLQKDFNDDLQKMRMTLESVEAVLQDAERRSIKDAAVRLWLKRLKEAMYDISDMIDEFEAYATKAGARKWAVKIPRLTIVRKIAMARKMKMMRDKLKEITDQHHRFSFTADSSSNEKQVNDKRATSSYLEEPLIVGRTEDKERLLKILSEGVIQATMVQRITILPIYGIGGIGKTTLAKLVFNHTQFKDYCLVWIYVSQTFDLNKIGNSIISQVSKKESQITDREMIHNCLRDLLARRKIRKILIVLDDLWENDEFLLEDLKAMLKVGNVRMVIVIVTTRDEGIANKICTVEPYKLEPLKDDMCWNIIKQTSAFEQRDDTERLEQIGREIAKKCGGVALAAQSLGHMLQFMKFDEWVSVRNSDIWKESTSGYGSLPHHNVHASLLLSYNGMPSYLKLCFSYCAIFPQGHKIVKDELIHQWIALGFIEPSSIFSTRQLSKSYVKQLLGMSFLQHAKAPLIAGLHDEDDMFTMHDLVHYVARSVMVDEVLDAIKDNNIGGSRRRYALLTDCSKPLELFATLPAKIRALRFVDCAKIELVGGAFSSAKCLRVLDLSECVIQKLPYSIGKLKQLRYLNAPGVQDRIIPKCITKLSKLSYLSLRGSSAISALPESIGEMEGLMCLDLSGCLGIGKLPESFGELKNLVHLDLSNCSCVTGVSESLRSLTSLQYLNLSYCRNIGELPGALGSLTELQYLNLSRSSYLEGMSDAEILGTLTKLEYLNLSSELSDDEDKLPSSDLKRLPEALGSFTELNYLNLSGCCGIEELPKSFKKLKKLVHLDLSHCLRVEGIPEALGGLTKLQYLNLSHCCSSYGAQLHLRGLPEIMGNLTELRYLNLSKCLGTINHSFIDCISTLSNLEHLDLSDNGYRGRIPKSIASLKKLGTLNLSRCTLLQRLPESMAKMDSLKAVNVKGCHGLDESTLSRSNPLALLPLFVVHAGDGESTSTLALLQHANPDELKIRRLENMKSAQGAQSIKLKEKQRIEELEFEWTRDAERSVEDMEVLGELVPPSTLKRFKIRGYNNVSFPAWLMDIRHFLPNLNEIKMEDLPNCKCLPPLGQLPYLQKLLLADMHGITRIDEGFYGGEGAFPILQEFEIRGMKSLEEWNTTYSKSEQGSNELMFRSLVVLRIIDLPNCKCLPPLGQLPHLRKLFLADMHSITKIDEGFYGGERAFLELQEFELHGMESLEEWNTTYSRGEEGSNELTFPKLQTLRIIDCPMLRNMRQLTSLRGYNNVSFPAWLPYLHEIEMEDLPNCKYLPPLGQLPNLQKLLLAGMHGITKIDEGFYGGARAFPQLQQFELRGMKSLEEWNTTSLSLEDKDLAELPKWLGELTSLKRLDIANYPDLKDLQGNMRQLTSLQELRMFECGSMTSLPPWLGELTSLQSLSIRTCKGIKSLPDSIQQLTNLKRLYIFYCPKLKQWCELEENKKKLAHINEKCIDGQYLPNTRQQNQGPE